MITVLDIPLYDKGLVQSVREVIEDCISNPLKCSRCISASDAHVLILTKLNKNFCEILQKFHSNLPDGMPSVWIGKLKGAKEISRCYGPDFFREIIINSSNKKIKHYLYGGKEGIASRLKEVCEQKYNNHNIVGVGTPPFRDLTQAEILELADDINKKQVNILWIGLSTPKQHFLAQKLAPLIMVHYIIVVGAAFDFHTGNVRQAPRWIQRSGLEWLFRLCVEPKRLFFRYAKTVPLFLFFNLIEFVKWNFRKNK